MIWVIVSNFVFSIGILKKIGLRLYSHGITKSLRQFFKHICHTIQRGTIFTLVWYPLSPVIAARTTN